MNDHAIVAMRRQHPALTNNREMMWIVFSLGLTVYFLFVLTYELLKVFAIFRA
jgi:hypothetical protein